jgi:hypothetical protein
VASRSPVADSIGAHAIRAGEPRIFWPTFLVESLTGRPRADANVNRFLKTCDVVEGFPEGLARRAASFRAKAHQGSAVGALVIAMAEPGGDVLGGDLAELRALATHAVDVTVRRA